ncbi:AraC family transcriptional regulator [Acinetobacter bereziniae]|uniref:AraC family transcriptional regulator n=1 Tax=Acinetobacter bereziniae TaxID=106648 RepID=UPI0019010FF1|nr:AraC family transcriptional regulator [Acinetobacter bereziniae]MBJ9904386.1 AraC family transcriptional regulator [Acinetobacter bereziniae]MCU4320828.1 AraC family transcriptional regulator [Acinetobacter bereziniae]MCU4599464.1 AraC family transcriptional regulator [Acinetobacter bereziniae]
MYSDTTVEFWSDPQMPYVETRRACQSRICYKSHSHPTFSIGAVDCGISRFSSYFAQDQQIQAGSLVIIPAEIEHSCNPLENEVWSYQMMHLDAHWVVQLFSELVEDIEQLYPQHVPVLKPQIIHHSDAYQSFTQLNEVLFDSSLSISFKQQKLVEVLSEILLSHFELDLLKQSDYFQKYLSRMIALIERSQHILSLDELSQAVGISRYAIIRLFKNNFGLTPHAYQLNQKINTARHLLKSGQTIVQIAHALGFNDQSHFHHVFKSHTGITPKQFQTQFLSA